jgi:hypothetical protein
MAKRGRQKQLTKWEDLNFQQECSRIVAQNIPNLEKWIEVLGRTDPDKAIKAVLSIAEFPHARKSKDAITAPRSNITVNLFPAEAKKITAPLDDFIDITPKDDE